MSLAAKKAKRARRHSARHGAERRANWTDEERAADDTVTRLKSRSRWLDAFAAVGKADRVIRMVAPNGGGKTWVNPPFHEHFRAKLRGPIAGVKHTFTMLDDATNYARDEMRAWLAAAHLSGSSFLSTVFDVPNQPEREPSSRFRRGMTAHLLRLSLESSSPSPSSCGC